MPMSSLRYEYKDRLPGIGGPTVQVVLADERSFFIYESLICSSSRYFDAALGSDWAEAQDRVIHLTEYPAHTFEIYMQWLFSNNVHSLGVVPDGHSTVLSEWSVLVEAYLLGDYIQDTKFKDTVIDAMFSCAINIPLSDDLQKPCMSADEIYHNTPRHSPLQRLVVDLTVAREGPGFWSEEHEYELPTAFLKDMLAELAIVAAGGFPLEPSEAPRLSCLCKYHCHGDDPCHRKEDVP
ncbi:hypothetical protein P280DRAFT_514907 [Massarina eburnea CBS 473.64]|uniref:BTB domain-containing protein n=1 Tax=Massarina eburnea CBS 473.64 TaxID=1395130 RepID=A0A6A6SCL7_9PLEO|nr:hypothetical protein P280DRAFT_514907 [Massarina eburnea CBS 473.64]